MKKRLGLTGALALLAVAASPALAADVAFGSVQLGPTNTTQLGRLSRNGIQQDWTGTEIFPGVINPGTTYAYTSIAAPFAANAFQTIYYDVTFDDEATDLFASAYVDSYDPADKSLNWLGDAGSSGNYFPGDARFFDISVPTGHSLLLVVNSSTGTGGSSVANYFITAYSDTMYSENFRTSAVVPEPGTWLLMIAGFSLTGQFMRRRRAFA